MSELKYFVRRHKASDFRHKVMLFDGLKSGACVLEHSPRDATSSLPCSHFLSIYRVRAEHLLRYGTPHAVSLREDMLELCGEFEKTPEEGCCVWSFSVPPYYSIVAFEGAETNRVLGCILAADKRLMLPEDWKRLWHGEDTPV